MTNATTVLANARLILPDRVLRGALTLADGRIAAITPGEAVPAGAIDCAGDHLAPGLIELHTDNLERHIQPRPGVDWPHATAILAHDGELASVGITTVFDALRVGSIRSDNPAYAPYALPLANEINAMSRAGATRISHVLHLRVEICSETLIAEMEAFGPDHGVRLVSLMDHTPGQRQFRDLSRLKEYEQGKYGTSDARFDAQVARLIALGARVGAAHEAAAIGFARRLGAVIASHDDTTPAQVDRSAALGARLAEFPTTREAAEACRAKGILTILGGPNLIRGGSHSGNVAAEDLARAGLLDIVSSDYIPSSLLLSAWRLAEIWGDVPRAVATVTATPARATGLDDRGRLAPGLRADVIRIAEVGGTPRLRGVWSAGRQVG
ncbi:alpha-D-ribose 1-methylphosphonate 5-triphosphate diphosphatase [Paracoccus sphaerophysae]|uniref:Phosphonate metabolism protein PhnM n=1 Tax=Paracoccus sphaerophysae TaxID=690417 RepID=A0A099F5U3_9RHOB|nr:alpha-D-ribose 1-methylphosphonate 5-triphosphate diphosphatase [Paracoccus sphaerophysae]KGJ05482.1 phosphonate metabolism protein PhnM [Paracoccus sphaerophysae]